MDQSEKEQVELLAGLVVVEPEILNQRAVKIKDVADQELNMANRGGNVASCVIGSGKRPLAKPTPESSVSTVQNTQNNQPSEGRVNT